MFPTDLAGLVVDGPQHAFGPDAVVCARPAVIAVFRFGEPQRIAGLCAHDEQASSWIKTGRTKIGHPPFIGGDEAAITRGLFAGIGYWLAIAAYSFGPVDRAERHTE